MDMRRMTSLYGTEDNWSKNKYVIFGENNDNCLFLQAAYPLLLSFCSNRPKGEHLSVFMINFGPPVFIFRNIN